MPNPQQIMQYAGSAIAIIALILGLIFGTGDLSSQAGGGTVTTNPAPSNPSTGGRTPDADGCVYGTPNYWDCKQAKSPIGKKNPPLSPGELQRAKKEQFQQLVNYRNNARKDYGPIRIDPALEKSAQAFAEVLAKTPGDRIWHDPSFDGLENVAMDEIGYTHFVSIFSNSPAHASTMLTRGKDVRVGIGIAQDPVTGSYYCVQRYGV